MSVALVCDLMIEQGQDPGGVDQGERTEGSVRTKIQEDGTERPIFTL